MLTLPPTALGTICEYLGSGYGNPSDQEHDSNSKGKSNLSNTMIENDNALIKKVTSFRNLETPSRRQKIRINMPSSFCGSHIRTDTIGRRKASSSITGTTHNH